MFKTIFGLAFEGIKRRKRQSLLIFFVLLVSFTFAIILLSYTSSIAETNSQLRLDTYGSWYGAITDGIDSDLEYLESEEWVDDIATSVNYGATNAVLGDTVMGSLNFGTVDDSMLDMGIILESGRLPKASNEIAIESTELTEFGLASASSITLRFTFYSESGEESTVIEKTYKIVGVIKQYTGLWDTNASLNEAILSEDGINELLAEATESLDSEASVSPEYTYFFTVRSGYERTFESEVNSYLWSVREDLNVRYVSVNSVMSMEAEEAQLNTFYVWLVLAVTLLAVVMIYILQMQSDVRKIVRLRSIGSSKGQVRLLILVEALMLCVPALLLGTLLGLVGIKALLGLSVYSGSVNIAVSLPWNYLLTSAAVWIVGVLLVRMLTIQVALATPLTGRMGMQRKKSNFYGKFRRVLIMLMAILLSVSTIFTTINVAEPLNNYQEWTSKWSYCFYPYQGHNNVAVYLDNSTLSEISSAPGVTDVVAFSCFYSVLTTGSSDAAMNASVIVMDYEDVAKFLDVAGVDETEYENGESVIVQTVEGVGETALEVDDDATVNIDYANSMGVYGYVLSEDPSELVSISVNVASLQTVPTISDTLPFTMEFISDTFEFAGNGTAMFDTDFVICSKALLQNILDEIPENKVWNIDDVMLYHGQSEAEYYQALVYTNTNAENLATDTAMSNILKLTKDPTNDIQDVFFYRLNSQREINYANAQVYQQSIIMIIVSGVCIAIVVLLILVSTLRLETESEKKRYGILQAIGMSKRQRNIELIRKSMVRSIVSVVVAVFSYLGYYLLLNISSLITGVSPTAIISTLFTALATYGLTTPVLLIMLLVMFVVTFAICFGSKLSINKYSIMEMLREDR
ncbi:MAG: FtsX-like permease family protein [Oscillospiraceae bacterium]|nr:FtsX-like permease family protein [Oscillospiraceae bacterium]